MSSNVGLVGSVIIEQAQSLCAQIAHLPEDEAVAVLNAVRQSLHAVSPFNQEPIDCVQWVKADTVEGNSYNPNVVAPPEMKLLALSIRDNGFAMPVVVFLEGGVWRVVDGFHRHRVGREDKQVRARTKGYLPISVIRSEREDLEARMAATIQFNRARGKHTVEGMSEIVQELSRRNWSPEKIAKNLGMDADEVLRLKQISGLAEMFADREFSEAWEVSTDEQ